MSSIFVFELLLSFTHAESRASWKNADVCGYFLWIFSDESLNYSVSFQPFGHLFAHWNAVVSNTENDNFIPLLSTSYYFEIRNFTGIIIVMAETYICSSWW